MANWNWFTSLTSLFHVPHKPQTHNDLDGHHCLPRGLSNKLSDRFCCCYFFLSFSTLESYLDEDKKQKAEKTKTASGAPKGSVPVLAGAGKASRRARDGLASPEGSDSLPASWWDSHHPSSRQGAAYTALLSAGQKSIKFPTASKFPPLPSSSSSSLPNSIHHLHRPLFFF